MAAFTLAANTEASFTNEDSLTPSEFAPQSAKPLPGIPDLDYPTPFVVRRTFIDFEVVRPESLVDFWGDRETKSCPPGQIGTMSSEHESTRGAPPKPDVAHVLLEAGATTSSARSRSTSVGSSTVESNENGIGFFELSGHPETVVAPERVFVSAEVWRDEVVPQGVGLLGAWWPTGIPCPPTQPPHVDGPFLPEPEAPPVPSHTATRPILASVPVLYLSEAVSQSVVVSQPVAASPELPEVGTPELPSVGSAGHAAGTCKPCAHFAHSRGCATGLQCPFCHLCPPGELKRRQKALRQQRPRVQQQSWQAASAFRRRREWAAGRHEA
jgi:hypothetical protein